MIEKDRRSLIRIVTISVVVLWLALTPASSTFLHAQEMATPVPAVPTEVPVTPEATEPSAPIDLPATPTIGTPESEPTANQISPASVIPGGSLQGCTQTPPNGDITTSVPGKIACTLKVANRTADGTASQWGGIRIPMIATGFTASIVVSGIGTPLTFDSGPANVWRYFQFGNGVNGFRTATVTITITTTAASGTPFSATFESCSAGESGTSCNPDNLNPGSVLVTGQVPSSSILPLVEGTHYSFICTPLAPSVSFNSAMESVCRTSIPPTVGSLLAPILVSDIVTSRTGSAGWALEIFSMTNQKIVDIPGIYSYPTLARPALNLVGDSYSFRVRMTPNGCSSEQNSSVAVSLGIRRALLVVPGPVQYSPSRLFQATRTPSSASATIFAQPNDVIVPYSMSAPETSSTSFTIRYTVIGCEPWGGYVRMGPFSNTADPTTSTVAIQTSARHGPIVQNPANRTVLTMPPLSTINETATHVLSGTAPGQPVTVDQTIILDYTVSANTPTGSYQSTITVSTTNAP